MEQINQHGTSEFSKQLPHRGHVDKIYEWCKKKYGRSKHNGRYPEVVFRKGDYYDGEEWGYYDEVDKCIYINRDKHESIKDLVDTLIHEYTHYLQNMHHYQVLALYLDHENHPLEIEAEMISDRDSEECLKYLENLYKNSSNKEHLSCEEDIYKHNKKLTSNDDSSPINPWSIYSRGIISSIRCSRCPSPNSWIFRMDPV